MPYSYGLILIEGKYLPKSHILLHHKMHLPLWTKVQCQTSGTEHRVADLHIVLDMSVKGFYRLITHRLLVSIKKLKLQDIPRSTCPSTVHRLTLGKGIRHICTHRGQNKPGKHQCSIHILYNTRQRSNSTQALPDQCIVHGVWYRCHYLHNIHRLCKLKKIILM